MGRPHSTRPQKGQSNKEPRIQVVTCMKMGLGHSNDDLRARNAAPQPLRGGAKQRLCEACPGRDVGRGRVARGGFALAWGCTWIICTNIRPYARLKITSPLPSGALAEREEVQPARGGGQKGS